MRPTSNRLTIQFRGISRAAAVCTTAALLVACESPQMQGLKNAVTTGYDAGVQKSSFAGTTGQQSDGAATTSTEKKTAGTSASAIPTSGGRAKTAATFEGDVTCSNLVAPFEPTENLSALVELATTASFNSVGDMIKNVAAGGQPGAAAGAAAAQHKIPLQVRAAALRMNWLPMSAEVMYGREALKKMDDMVPRDSGVGRKLYPIADAMLAEILKAVKEPHAYTFELFINPGSGENAKALPGGFLIMDAALLQNPALRDKAYFALAHELGHVLQRHETRALQARFIDVLSLMGTVQNMVHQIRTVNADPRPLVNLALGGKIQFSRHYSSQELHSDGCAVRLLDQTWGNNQRLGAVLQGYMAGLLRDFPQESKVETPAANRNLPAALQPLATRVNKTSDEVTDLVEMARSPLDAHPVPKERIDNLKLTYGEVVRRVKPTAAANAPKPAQSAAPARPPTAKVRP